MVHLYHTWVQLIGQGHMITDCTMRPLHLQFIGKISLPPSALFGWFVSVS